MQPIEDPKIASLLSRWYDLFALNQVTVRVVVSTALDHDDRLLEVIRDLIPEFIAAPQPKTLSRWLLRHENFPIAITPDLAYRLARGKTTMDGALWRLHPLTVEVAAVA